MDSSVGNKVCLKTSCTPLQRKFESSWGHKNAVMCEWSIYNWEVPGLFCTTKLSSETIVDVIVSEYMVEKE